VPDTREKARKKTAQTGQPQAQETHQTGKSERSGKETRNKAGKKTRKTGKNHREKHRAYKLSWFWFLKSESDNSYSSNEEGGGKPNW
jgi:hypothetical protein